MRDKILKIKKWHSILSSIIFFCVLGFCVWTVNKKITQISLSQFGIEDNTSIIWNLVLFLVGIFLYLESMKNIYKHLLEIPKFLPKLFGISSICLVLTALFNMDYQVHNIVAFLYFLGYTLSIFLFGKYLLKYNFRIGMISIIISILSMLIPSFLVYKIDGLAIPEICHAVFIFMWVVVMSWENEIKNILKIFGF